MHNFVLQDPQTQETPDLSVEGPCPKRRLGRHSGSADLDDRLVVAEQDHADAEADVGRQSRSARTEVQLDREGRGTGEGDRVLPVHPDAAVAVVQRADLVSGGVSDGTEDTAARTSEHQGADEHLRLGEVPGENAVVEGGLGVEGD